MADAPEIVSANQAPPVSVETPATPTSATRSRKPPVKPSQEDHKKKMGELDQDIEDIRKRLSTVKDKIGGKHSSNGQTNDKRSILRSELKEIRGKQAAIKQQRQQIFDRLDATNKSVKAKIEDLRASKEKARFRSLSEVDEEIRRLERRIESGSLKLVEEKRAVNDITSMKKHRRTVETFQPKQDNIDSEKKQIDEIRKELDKFQTKDLSQRSAEIEQELEELNKAHEADMDKRRELINQRDELNRELDDKFNQRRELQSAYRQSNDEYYQWQQEDRARKQEAFRRRRQQEHEEKVQASISAEREAAAIPAFYQELSSCDAILAYLQTHFLDLIGETITTTTNDDDDDKDKQTVGVPALAPRQVDTAAHVPKGAVLKKKGRDEDSYFVGASAKSSKKSGRKEPSTKVAALKLPLTLMERFWEVKLEVPTSRDDIPKTLEAVQERKQWYLDNQSKVTEENKAKAEEKIIRMQKQADEARLEDERRERDRHSSRSTGYRGDRRGRADHRATSTRTTEVEVDEGGKEEGEREEVTVVEVTNGSVTNFEKDLWPTPEAAIPEELPKEPTPEELAAEEKRKQNLGAWGKSLA